MSYITRQLDDLIRDGRALGEAIAAVVDAVYVSDLIVLPPAGAPNTWEVRRAKIAGFLMEAIDQVTGQTPGKQVILAAAEVALVDVHTAMKAHDALEEACREYRYAALNEVA